MRIHGILVTRNEADRYLQSSIQWAKTFVDDLHVYDDQSTDATIDIVKKETPNWAVRDDSIPAFSENEGAFRNAAWFSFEELVEPEKGDWVVTFDADEFLVGPEKNWNPRESLESLADMAVHLKRASCNVSIPEVWNVDGVCPLIRKDGFWKGNFAPRFFEYRPMGNFLNGDGFKRRACGSVPSYVLKEKMLTSVSMVSMLHFGYADHNDKIAKYDSYKAMDDHGHNPQHIESIIGVPVMKEWLGAVPKFWRGVRDV